MSGPLWYTLIFLLLPSMLYGMQGSVHLQLKVQEQGFYEVQVPLRYGSKPYFSDLQRYGGELGIWIADKQSNTLSGYGYGNGKLLAEWDFSSSKVGGVRTFFIHSPDSILIYCKNTDYARALFWYNAGTKSFQPVVYAEYLKLPGSTSSQDEWETIEASSGAPLRFHQGQIIGGLLPYLSLNQTLDVYKSLVFTLDVPQNIFKRLPIYHSSAYRSQEIHYDYAAIRTLLKGDSLIISFGGSPELSIWNLVESRLSTMSLEVPGIHLSSPPCVDSGLTAVQQLLTKGLYGRIFYHERLRLYMRVVYLPTPLIDPSNGLYTPFDERKACLFIWDEHFEPQTFILLPAGANDRNAFCTPEGFMILSPQDSKVDSTQRTLRYAHYNFSYEIPD